MLVNRRDSSTQGFVLSSSHADRSASPRVIAAGRDIQHPAHRADRKQGLMRVYEEEGLFDPFSVSCANQAAAFSKISRSSRSRSFSRRRCCSSSRSLVVSPSRFPSSRSAWATQFRIACPDGELTRQILGRPSFPYEGHHLLLELFGVRLVRSSWHHGSPNLLESTKSGQLQGFLGSVDGKNVVILVYKDGKNAGKVATSFVPSAEQLRKWGVSQ